MQSELPNPETLPADYEFNLVEFLNENWFYLLGFFLIVGIVVFYSSYRKQQMKK